MASQNSDVFKIDTKGVCLLCFKRCPSTSVSALERFQSLNGFKQFLRYVRVTNIDIFKESFPDMEFEMGQDINVEVLMCSNCSKVTSKFDKLHQRFESIRLELNGCVQTLFDSMTAGDDNPDLVREYKENMRAKKLNEMINSNIAFTLRKETLFKCNVKLTSTPKVNLQNINCDFTPSTLPTLSTDKEQDMDVDVASLIPENVSSEDESDSSDSDDEAVATADQSTKSVGNVLAEKKKNRYGQFSCSYCAMKHSAYDALEIHLALKHFEQEISKHFPKIYSRACIKAIQTVTSHPPLFGFLKKHTNQCCYCAKKMTPKQNVKYHILSEHRTVIIDLVGKQLTLNLKDTQDDNASDMDDEEYLGEEQSGKEIIDKRKYYRCDHCSSKWRTKAGLKHHITQSHYEELVEKLLPIKMPRNDFRKAINRLIIQMKGVNTSVMQVSCRYCSLFLRRSSIKSHVFRKHGSEFAQDVLEMFKNAANWCVKCRECFTDLGNHVDTIHNKFSCKYCEFVANSDLNLKYHVVGTHALELVQDKLPPETTREDCDKELRLVFESVELSNGRCLLCNEEVVSGSTFWRHLLAQHLDHVVGEITKKIDKSGE